MPRRTPKKMPAYKKKAIVLTSSLYCYYAVRDAFRSATKIYGNGTETLSAINKAFPAVQDLVSLAYSLA